MVGAPPIGITVGNTPGGIQLPPRRPIPDAPYPAPPSPQIDVGGRPDPLPPPGMPQTKPDIPIVKPGIPTVPGPPMVPGMASGQFVTNLNALFKHQWAQTAMFGLIAFAAGWGFGMAFARRKS